MPRLVLFDTVVLKSDRRLCGVVDRTHYESPDPLEDCLIVEHTKVDSTALQSFLESGVPPRDHVFIQFADPKFGHSLVLEEDTELVNRALTLGDNVRIPGKAFLGTVIDISEEFVLQPVWKATLSRGGEVVVEPTGAAPCNPSHQCDASCPVPQLLIDPDVRPHDLIGGVPARELKKIHDLDVTDAVIKEDWVGLVEELDLSIALLLGDHSIVIIDGFEELYIPIPEYAERIIAVPQHDLEVRKPDIVVAQYGYPSMVPLALGFVSVGRFVVTNQSNLKNGRWLRGRYDSQMPAQGYIIDIRSKNVYARWLTCNAFIKDHSNKVSPPSSHLDIYENLKVAPCGSELRRNKNVALYDHNKVPQQVEDRRRHNTYEKRPQGTTRVSTYSNIHIGDQVKFRNSAEAAVKYQGFQTSDCVVHGKFERHAPSSLFGFDANELNVISSHKNVLVHWQDGTESMHRSTSLYRYDLFDTDLVPSDIVVAREGMQQRPALEGSEQDRLPWSSYNEMTCFERRHDLKPNKVGVLQNVDPVERVAQVRWYTAPSIVLFGAGNILGGESRFGPLGEQIEDISLYEVMTFPALARKLKDYVLLAPEFTSIDVLKAMKLRMCFFPEVGLAPISSIKMKDRPRWLKESASKVTKNNAPVAIESSDGYRTRPSLDWFGEIVGIGTDGVVTVRINTGDFSKDIWLEHDQMLVFIDEAVLVGDDDDGGDDDDDDGMELDVSYMEDGFYDSDMMSRISETVEYEGGERMDEDSGDDNWEDADDVQMSGTTVPDPEQTDEDSDIPASSVEEMVGDVSSELQVEPDTNVQHESMSSQSPMALNLLKILPTEAPPAFDVLEMEPPPDQYQASKDAVKNSPAFLKRIVKEHKILNSSLPVGEIYIRTYENRLDLMRCLIIGPADTPFEDAPFLIDLQFTSKFPNEPPVAHFHSWTSGLGRINPNLYEEGKICLSLLGTWQGKSESESWSDKATVLQLLISLQGLVFVRQPFYNEAGYEEAAADNAYPVESYRYNERSFVMARAFVKHALSNNVGGIMDILAWTYLSIPVENGDNNINTKDDNATGPLLARIINRGKALIDVSEQQRSNSSRVSSSPSIATSPQGFLDGSGQQHVNSTRSFLRPLSKGAIVMLKKTIGTLEDLLDIVTNHNSSQDQDQDQVRDKDEDQEQDLID